MQHYKNPFNTKTIHATLKKIHATLNKIRATLKKTCEHTEFKKNHATLCHTAQHISNPMQHTHTFQASRVFPGGTDASSRDKFNNSSA